MNIFNYIRVWLFYRDFSKHPTKYEYRFYSDYFSKSSDWRSCQSIIINYRLNYKYSTIKNKSLIINLTHGYLEVRPTNIGLFKEKLKKI